MRFCDGNQEGVVVIDKLPDRFGCAMEATYIPSDEIEVALKVMSHGDWWRGRGCEEMGGGAGCERLHETGIRLQIIISCLV
jgi:hypothetical protein